MLVSRLNGHGIPAGEKEWLEKHRDKKGLSWYRDRDRLLPGYKDEWKSIRPNGGQVVGVTGDGTNDAPALKAADVGLSMGITGTKVAQYASDIVILDDKFSSIVRAITWGRAVYDNIRKFLQFQVTVSAVALVTVFVGIMAGFDSPLNPVMMLWVNLIMDSVSALALATEPPTPELLNRRPYCRNALLISLPMWRNIIVQTLFQLLLLFLLLWLGPSWFNVRKGEWCDKYSIRHTHYKWDLYSSTLVPSDYSGDDSSFITCDFFRTVCGSNPDDNCLEGTYRISDYFTSSSTTAGDSGSGGGSPTVGTNEDFNFQNLNRFQELCLECSSYNWAHYTIIFNTFVFCQIFNEFNCRSIFDEVNVFRGICSNQIFIWVIFAITASQVFFVQYGGIFTQTTPLSLLQWGQTVGLAALSLPIGVLMRFIPVKEDPRDFYNNMQCPAVGVE